MNLKTRPLPPFDLDLSAMLFLNGDWRIRRYEAGAYWQVVRLDERLALVTVRSLGTVEELVLSIDIEPDEGLSEAEVMTAEAVIRRIFNLDLDLQPFYEAVKGDRVLSQIARRLRGLKPPSTTSVFEALIDSMYVRDVSRLVIDGLDLEGLRDFDDERIIEELSKIRGVGVWTAELTMVRGMQRFDAIPADDLGLRRAVSHYYYDDRKISGQEARHTAEQWKGWRGLAAFYLIVGERLGIDPD